MKCPRCDTLLMVAWGGPGECKGSCDFCGLEWEFKWQDVVRSITDDERALLKELQTDPGPTDPRQWSDVTGYCPSSIRQISQTTITTNGIPSLQKAMKKAGAAAARKKERGIWRRIFGHGHSPTK